MASFQYVAPRNGFLYTDVTDDCKFWLDQPLQNRGYVFLTDSNDGWDWTTAESGNNPPALIIESIDQLPTMAPTFADRPPTLVFDGAFDAEINAGSPTGSIGGSNPIVTVDLSSGGFQSMGLLKFDITGLSTLRSAELKLTASSGTIGTISAYYMLTPWDEATVAWQDFGPNGILFDDVIASSTPSFTWTNIGNGDILTADVTQDVQTWFAEPENVNQGWVFVSDSLDDFSWVSADDASNGPPQLNIVGTIPSPTMRPTGQFTSDITDVIDAEIRSSVPDTPLGSLQTRITVDLSTGGAVTNALMKFNLEGFTGEVSKATLELLTVSPTSGTVSGYRMLQDWDNNATWNFFGGDGVQEDDVEARSTPSFQLVAPTWLSIEQIDVTDDVNAWIRDGEPNFGWVFLTDSNDGWDFNTKEANLFQPTLRINSVNPLPTMAPTSSLSTQQVVLEFVDETEIRSDAPFEPQGQLERISVDLSAEIKILRWTFYFLAVCVVVFSKLGSFQGETKQNFWIFFTFIYSILF